MPTITFNVTFAARNDHTPTHDGLTYHHVLPWRYYYLAGYLLASAARLRLLRQSSINGMYVGPAVQAMRQSGVKPAAEYGAEFAQFDDENLLTHKEMLNLCASLHGTAIAGVNAIELDLNGAVFDLGKIGNRCGAPKCGGFLGMAPEQRKDDPSSGVEQHRPLGASINWFAALSLLRVALKTACPDIDGAKAHSTIAATLSTTTLELIVKQVRLLVRDHNAAPYDFDVDDWYLHDGAPRNWDFLTGVPAAALGGKTPTKIGPVFCLRQREVQCGHRIGYPHRQSSRLDHKVYSPLPKDQKYMYWYPTTAPGLAL